MGSVTLAESAKLAQDDFTAGLIEAIVTVDEFYDMMPFDGIDGNSLLYNRENTLGPVATAGVGDTEGVIGAAASGGGNLAERQAAKDPATFEQVTSALTTILGDAEVNGLIQATRSGDGNDQTAVQIASKAKSAGRKYRDMLINGTGSNHQFTGLLSLVPSAQKADTGLDGRAFDFDVLDELIDLVKDKDGQVDYFMMPARTIRTFLSKLRALGGASINETLTLPSGRRVHQYRGIPVFKNDNIPTDQVKGESMNTTTLFAGTFDDGSRQHGIAGLTAQEAAGVQVVDVGEHQDKDDHIWRVKWYCGLALFSELGIAAADGITD